MSNNRSINSGDYKSGFLNSNSKEHRGSTNYISRQTDNIVYDPNRLKNYKKTLKPEQNILPNKNALNMKDKTSSGHDYCSLNYNELNNSRVSYQDLEIKCKEKSQELENLRVNFQNSETAKNKYEKRFNRLRLINEEHENELNEKSQELENLRLNVQNSEMARNKYENRFNRLRRTYDELKNESNDLKAKLENLEGKYDELEMNYELKNSSIIILEKKVDTLENEKNNSIKKIEELEADLQKKQNAVITIRNKYKTLQNTNDELSGLTIFKAQSLSFKKQNEDYKYQLSVLTKSNENLSTQLELIKNENNQLKAEIKNLKLLKFTSKPISSISTYNIQDSYNFIDQNKMSQVKNEHSTQSFVNNELESNNKAKHNVNCTESKHFNKFPAWWYNHMNCEISTIQMESTTKENIKSKTNFNNTKSLMFTDASYLQNSDIDNENFQVKNKKSEQTFVNIANHPSRKDENYQMNTNHSNHKYRA